MKKLLISALILTLVSYTIKDPNVVGRWEAKYLDGTITTVFKADHIYEVYFNKKMFSKGTYSFKDSIITFEDDEMADLCSDIKGTYKLTFSADTVMSFNVINDDCPPRSKGTNGLIYARVKE